MFELFLSKVSMWKFAYELNVSKNYVGFFILFESSHDSRISPRKFSSKQHLHEPTNNVKTSIHSSRNSRRKGITISIHAGLVLALTKWLALARHSPAGYSAFNRIVIAYWVLTNALHLFFEIISSNNFTRYEGLQKKHSQHQNKVDKLCKWITYTYSNTLNTFAKTLLYLKIDKPVHKLLKFKRVLKFFQKSQ